MKMILFMNLTLSMLFMFPNHPIMMMIIMLLQTILICMINGLLMNSWWFSYMTFMVMIGGLLILFMYMTNTASNEKFKIYKMKNLLMKMMMSLTLMLLIFKDTLYTHIQASNWMNLNKMSMEITIMKYYNFPFNMILFMMMIFLLITLIMTVKLTEMKKGALRQKF